MTPPQNPSAPTAGIRLYLLAATACILTGWGLSVVRGLTLPGYLVALPLVFAGLVWLTKENRCAPPWRCGRGCRRSRLRRFRRPLPFVFLVAAAGVFAGGMLYPPNNYDAITYRLPRMVNWLSTHGWTWIFTNNERMNYSGTGWEWMAMPSMVFFRSDRLLFLVNALGFLLLPGLIFSVFRQAGIASRVAWAWMWILPMAFGYVLQAGSIGNDFAGAVFGLIAVHYGLRARRSGQVTDVWLAGLAAAILTGIKSSNLPLALPCLVAVWPALKLWRQRWSAGICVVLVAVTVSVIPTAAFNQIHTGMWTGDPENHGKMQARDPAAAFLGNSLLLAQQFLMPPLLPQAHRVNAWIDCHLPASWHRTLEEGFPRYALQRLNELPQEEAASVGLGVTVLVLIALGAAWFRRSADRADRFLWRKLCLTGVAAWVACLVVMLKMGSESTARLMLPYYPLVLIPILNLPGQAWLVRQKAWRIVAVLVSFSVLPCMVLTPARPLWPARAASEWMAAHRPASSFTQRANTVYSIYRNRNDLLAPLRHQLPDTATHIGFIAGGNDSDYSLRRPFGRRRVTHLWDEIHPVSPLPPDVDWLVINRDIWPKVSDVPVEQWAARNRLEIVSSVLVTPYVAAGNQTWLLLRRAP